MLLSFRFQNHRSFRDEAQLNLLPVYAPKDPATPVVGVFGANASGKSNLISALAFMSSLVGRSDRDVEPGLGLRRHPFRLDPRVEGEPSSYAVDLLLEGVRYTYGFTITDDRILAEWLYSYPRGSRRKLFERNEKGFTWGEYSKGTPLEALSDITAKTALFLSVTARFGRFDTRSPNIEFMDGLFAPFHGVYTWLWQKVVRSYPGPTRISGRRIGDIVATESDRFRTLVDLLRSADLGLLDMSVRHPDGDPFEQALASGTGTTISGTDYSRPSRKGPRLQFRHRGAVDSVLFEIDDESDGTIRLLDLATQSLAALDSGGLLLADEVDSSLHPLLTAQLIELFQSKSANPSGAQLIFTSHDATLLGTLGGIEVLSRDQIWFVEKEDDGASILYSLVEFKPRKQDENRQRRYLSGKYGAIPDLSMRLFERALQTRNEEVAE